MTSYRVEYARAAAKVLEKMHAHLSAPIRKKIGELAASPRPQGVIYEIQDNELLVLVVRIANRKDVYWDT